MPLTPLPIDETLPELLAALASDGAVVLEAPPGSGKTTRVPPALMAAVVGQVWVLEPRRVAARAASARVAFELGEPVGERIGYAMRMDRKSGPKTRVLYVTEALLTRRLDDLEGIDAVVLDEFHERSIHADVALGWVKALRVRRPELKLVVMSATLDGEAIARFLGCQRIRATGRLFPVDVRYTDRKDERAIEHRVAAGVRTVEGNVLAFLPGIGEIERTAELLSDLDVFPLHGELDGAAQDKALRGTTSGLRRVVLATNVAETSITVEGISAVVDCGLARQASFDPWTGLPTLDLAPIARDSAAQRAGRAGRLGPGVCLRLFSKADHDARPAQTLPEIRRIDLAPTVLALGGRDIEWLEAPPPGAWNAAITLLERLGAIHSRETTRVDESAGADLAAGADKRPVAGERTVIGEAMAGLPLVPRLGRVLIEAAALGAAREGAALVAVLSGRRAGPRDQGRDQVRDPVEVALDGGGDPRERRLLESFVRDGSRRAPDAHAVLIRALLSGFPDRVGRREGGRVRLADGGAAECATGRDGYVIVSEVERIGSRVRARSLTPVDESLLLDGAVVTNSLRWSGSRVECLEELKFGGLVLDSAPGTGAATEVAAMLYDHASAVLHQHVPDWEAGKALLQRVAFLRRVGVDLPNLDEAALGQATCEGCRSLNDLGSASFVAVIEAKLGAASTLVRKLAPDCVTLPGRSRAPIDYSGDEPFVSSRMQDFFGLSNGPRIANDHPLVLHLLAPNYRAVQVTRDLAGFWQRLYPEVRKELSRRYPRHKWPADPTAL